MVTPGTKRQLTDVTVTDVPGETESHRIFFFLWEVVELPLFLTDRVDQVSLALDQLLDAVVGERGDDEHTDQTELQQTPPPGTSKCEAMRRLKLKKCF